MSGAFCSSCGASVQAPSVSNAAPNGAPYAGPQVPPPNTPPPNVPPPPGYAAPQYAPPYGLPQPYVPRKSRVGYILLGVFLGCFGIHNFYAGYSGRGLTQLLITLCTVFLASPVTAIWAIVEVCTVTVDAHGVPFD